MSYDDLLKKYEALLKSHQHSEEATEEQRALFERTHEILESSLQDLLNDYETTLKLFADENRTFIADLKKLYSAETNRIQDEFLSANEQFEKELNEAEASKDQVFEDTFKVDETIDQTYQTVYDTANAHQDKALEAIKNEIDAYALDHSHKQKEIKASTEAQEKAIQKTIEEEKNHYSEAFNRLSTHSEKTKKEIIKSRESFKTNGVKPIQKLEEAYHTEIKPFVEKMGQIKLEYNQKLEKASSKFGSQKTKIQGYINEAKKIQDAATIKKYTQELMTLKDHHESHIASIHQQLSQALEPIKLEHDTVQKEYQGKLFKAKTGYIQTILDSMQKLEETKTDEMLQVDDINLNFNIAEKKQLTQLELNKIDYLVQSLNYDQYKFEKTLIKEKEKALLGPAFDKAILSAKETLQSGHAEQEKLRQEVTYQLEYAKQLFDLNRSHAASDKNSKQRFLEAYFSHDKSLADLRLSRKKHQVYLIREQYINQLYTQFSSNYTALSAGWLDPWLDPLKEEQRAALERLKDSLNQIKSKAMADHERLLSAIELIYQAEITPLKEELKSEETLKKTEIQKQEAVYKKQTNTLKSKESASPKRLDKALESLAIDHQKIIKRINREFDEKVKALKALMQNVENARIYSTEEANTLLNHVLDQADTRLSETEALMQEEIRLFNAGKTYLDKSAGLFSWFQDQRLDKTEQALDALNQSKSERFSKEEAELLKSFEEKLSKIDEQDSEAYEAYQRKRHAMNETHQAKLNQLYQDHDAYLKQNHQEIMTQLKQVENNHKELTEEYDAQIAELDRQVSEKRNKYFADKTKLEEQLTRDIDQLKRDYKAVRNQKETQLKTILDTYQTQLNALREKLEKDAILTLQVKDLRYIEGLLETSIPMRSIIEES